uniref:Uncharacterized protein n=1 Tax=Arundo donax TaxID=35708 RepID=A0A0A9GVJ2_ARUDO
MKMKYQLANGILISFFSSHEPELAASSNWIVQTLRFPARPYLLRIIKGTNWMRNWLHNNSIKTFQFPGS